MWNQIYRCTIQLLPKSIDIAECLLRMPVEVLIGDNCSHIRAWYKSWCNIPIQNKIFIYYNKCIYAKSGHTCTCCCDLILYWLHNSTMPQCIACSRSPRNVLHSPRYIIELSYTNCSDRLCNDFPVMKPTLNKKWEDYFVFQKFWPSEDIWMAI